MVIYYTNILSEAGGKTSSYQEFHYIGMDCALSVKAVYEVHRRHG